MVLSFSLTHIPSHMAFFLISWLRELCHCDVGIKDLAKLKKTIKVFFDTCKLISSLMQLH